MVYAYHSLRLAGILLQPIMPTKASELLDRLGVPSSARGWEDAVWLMEVDTVKMVRRLKEGKTAHPGQLFAKIEHESAVP
jgi:methionyl-tRNA synthetase